MTSGITLEQREALRALGPTLPGAAYLGGDVAVALTFEHRESHDLDFFVPEDFDPQRLAEQLQAALPTGSFMTTSTAPGTLYLELSGVPASVMTYRYPLLAPPESVSELGARVASLVDLTCMKLSAIASRGAARDFWDLHTMLVAGTAGGSLGTALSHFRLKFAADDIGHVVRSLAYFGDAEADPLPAGLDADRWVAIKAWFEREVSALE
jgi:hypothetical protein